MTAPSAPESSEEDITTGSMTSVMMRPMPTSSASKQTQLDWNMPQLWAKNRSKSSREYKVRYTYSIFLSTSS